MLDEQLSFPLLHHSPSPSSHTHSNTFLPFPPHHSHHSNLFLHPPHPSLKDQHNANHVQLNDSWTNDEVLALLAIRSTMDNCFPQLTWDHVSRKLGEIGFKKSAEKCKERFEEESRYLENYANCNKDNNVGFLSEVEELCDTVAVSESEEKTDHLGGDNNMGQALLMQQLCEVGSDKSKERKRKRRERFEMFKSFCESVVNKLMAQQEEIHNKLIEDMVKRDQDKLAREEAWKKQETDRMNKELDIMAQEQAIAGDRHATIIEFLKKCSATTTQNGNNNNNNNKASSPLHSQNPNNLESCKMDDQNQNQNQTTTTVATALGGKNPSSSDTLFPSSSNSSLKSHKNQLESNKSVSTHKSGSEKEDVGRRWPRDEVLALINLRCTGVGSNNNEEKQQEGNNNNKGPLWERISQGMSELGYKRSAKRCKEKWENINKYFRKTKDVNKKRSLDSRTCPYFHQLSSLYGQRKLVVPQSQYQEINATAINTDQDQPQTHHSSHQVGSAIEYAC